MPVSKSCSKAALNHNLGDSQDDISVAQDTGSILLAEPGFKHIPLSVPLLHFHSLLNPSISSFMLPFLARSQSDNLW